MSMCALLSVCCRFQGSIDDLDAGKLDTLEGTVFDETIQLYEHVKGEMLNCIRAYVLDDVKARSRPYRWNK